MQISEIHSEIYKMCQLYRNESSTLIIKMYSHLGLQIHDSSALDNPYDFEFWHIDLKVKARQAPALQ